MNWKSAAIKDGSVVPAKKAPKKTGKKPGKKTPKKPMGETWEDATPEKPTKATPKKAATKSGKITFAELTDQFWAQYKNETVTPKEVQDIYSVLQFAFNKLN